MEAKFTKGPVTIEQVGCGVSGFIYARIIGAGRSLACAGVYQSDKHNRKTRKDEQAMADACLIAAAFNAATEMEELGCDGQASIETLKEMYDLLEQLTGEFQVVLSSGEGRGVEWFEKRIRRIEKKLAKARGET